MKIDNLLGPYLYQYKMLSLPGIGQFTMDDKAVIGDEKLPIQGVSFNQKTGPQLQDSLILYIKEHTGKMKPLAEADLHSFITTAYQYLNIGKPYYFEGIGTLQKNKDGGYHFTAGTVAPKTEDAPVRFTETSRKSTYNPEGAGTANGNASSGKWLVVVGILATLGLIAWGGYYLYSKNTSEGEASSPATSEALTPIKDSQANMVAIDSSGKLPDSLRSKLATDSAMASKVAKDSAATPAGSYKFVFETTSKKARALKRYDQLKDVTVLKTYNNKVAIETPDSTQFKLYTIVSCTPADTAHVKELLNAWYYGTKEMKVKIEQ